MTNSSTATVENQTEAALLTSYLEAHNATLVTTDGSYAVSVHGEILVGKRVVPYHLVPDEGFLGKTSKWRKLDIGERFALLQERWNEAAKSKLETQLQKCAEVVVTTAHEFELDPSSALHALVAK